MSISEDFEINEILRAPKTLPNGTIRSPTGEKPAALGRLRFRVN